MIEKIELCNDLIDFTSTLTDGEDILDFASDNIPGLKILVRTYNSVSDRIFKIKIDKFIKYANNFTIDNNFEKFKLNIRDDLAYRNKVSQYILFKINKFDVDYKLKIFSRACVDFFNSNITENTLIEISEVIDNLNRTDIEVIKCLHKYDSDLIQVKSVVDELLDTIDNFKTYSSILKLINYGIVLEELQSTWDSIGNKQFKKIVISPFAKIIYKYL